jgi:MscS family membrane protein
MTDIQECCNFFWDTLDGKYGWLAEAILLVSMVLFISVFVRSLLKKLHFKFEREHKPFQDTFCRAIYKPLSYYVWFIAIINCADLISLRVNGQNFFAIEHMHQMVTIGAIIALAWFLTRWKKFLIANLVERSKKHEIALDQGKIDIVAKAWTIFIVCFTILLIMEVTERNFTTLLAFGGIGGLAFAFASQEMIANFFGSFMIYVTRPFTVGDWVKLPERDVEGHVEEIGWYMTRVRTFEKRPIYVPNSIFSKMVLVTPSRMTHRQFKEVFGLRYGDYDAVRPIITEIKKVLEKHPEIDHTLRKMVNLVAFGEYSIDIEVDVYISRVDSEGFAEIKQELLFTIADIIRNHGAEMAYPTSNIEIKLDQLVAMQQHTRVSAAKYLAKDN